MEKWLKFTYDRFLTFFNPNSEQQIWKQKLDNHHFLILQYNYYEEIGWLIGWLVEATWNQATPGSIKHCHKSYGFTTNVYVATSPDCDKEFQMLLIVLLTSMIMQIIPWQYLKKLTSG